jgi:UDP-N-acetylmuramoyl-L-alanyl-D-glutamate--2,6-diaminopimelate ligase
MLTEKGSTFSIHTPWGKGKIRSQLLGRFNIYNVLAALSAGGVLGLNLDTMIRTLSKIPAVSGRLERVQNRKKLHVFIDYAHTDDALKNVLKTLREICKGRLVVVFGCGGDRDRKKRRLMGRVAAELADHIVVTSDNPRKEEPEEIIAEILEGMPSLENVDVVVDRREAIRAGLSKLKRKDILLVAGKGHETYQELRDTIIPFNDRDVVREILG